MSRVAKSPIKLPSQVQVSFGEKMITVSGPKGSMSCHLNPLVSVVLDDDQVLTFKPASENPNAWAQAGTARANVNNMVTGVTTGYTRTLELVGVGYRAQSKDGALSLSLGFSHPEEFQLPEGIKAETPNVTTIVLSGIDYQLLNQVASNIRALRPPEPYKGKGIKYSDEVIIRKETKKK